MEKVGEHQQEGLIHLLLFLSFAKTLKKNEDICILWIGVSAASK